MPEIQAEDVNDSTGIESVDQSAEIATLLMGDEVEKPEDKSKATKEVEEPSEDAEVDDLEEDEEAEVEEEEEGDDIDTWESALGVSDGQLNIDDKGNLAGVNVKVNGQTATVSMPDLIEGYQTKKAFTQKSQVFAEEKKVFYDQKEQVEHGLQTRLNDVLSLNQYLEKQVSAEFENVDWNNLRFENPAEFAALKQDYSDRAKQLQDIRVAANDAMTKQSNDTKQADFAANNKHLREQTDQMLINNPSWASEEVYAKDMTRIRAFCSDKYGFTKEDFSTVNDSRIIELIKDAEKYHQGVSVAKTKFKKKVPKFQKSAGSSQKKASRLEKLTSAANKAKGAEKRDLQSSAIAELISGG